MTQALPGIDVTTNEPLGLYVHLPWCVRKCPYCDFNSHPLKGSLPAEPYVAALLNDLEQWSGSIERREISTVFLGGGTPSLFSADLVGGLLEGIANRVGLSATAEITLEANPGTVERDSFTAYRAAGVNRVSLGVQSFNDAALKRLGRIHGREDIDRSIRSLARAGLDNFNIDLMFGLPEQTVEAALEDIRLALRAAPAHLSHYQLTLEPNTAFAHDPPPLPADEACWEMQETAASELTAAGFHQYEVSAWARPGRQCAHNLNYWRYGDFIGIGAGAHGKLTDVTGDAVTRWSMPRQPRVYLDQSQPPAQRSVPPDERVFEYFLNRLRLREPITRVDFSRRTGLAWSVVEDRVNEARDRGLLSVSEDGFRTTDLGWRFLNDTQQVFLP